MVQRSLDVSYQHLEGLGQKLVPHLSDLGARFPGLVARLPSASDIGAHLPSEVELSAALVQTVKGSTARLCGTGDLTAPRLATLSLQLSIALPWTFRLGSSLPWLAEVYVVSSIVSMGLGIPALLTLPVYALHLYAQTGKEASPYAPRSASTSVPLLLVALYPLLLAAVGYRLLPWPVLTLWPALFLVALSVVSRLRPRRLPAHAEEAAEAVANAYESRWMAYRRLALLSLGLWAYGLYGMVYKAPGYALVALATVLRALLPQHPTAEPYLHTYCPSWATSLRVLHHAQIEAEARWTGLDTSIAMHTGALLLLPLGVLVLETLSTRATPRGLHPLTAAPFDPREASATRALALAPAGAPALEAGIRRPLTSLLLAATAGPAFPLALWWSAGEERAGWLARGAARDLVVEGLK